MNRHISPDVVKAQVQRLLYDNPELKNDDEALVMSLESETDAFTLAEILVTKIGEKKAASSGLAAYISELRGRHDDMDRQIESMRTALFKIMEAAELKTLPLSISTVAIRPGPAKVIVTDMDRLPEVCIRQPPPEPNKNLIKEMLKNGDQVPGAFLSNGEDVLSIRVR